MWSTEMNFISFTASILTAKSRQCVSTELNSVLSIICSRWTERRHSLLKFINYGFAQNLAQDKVQEDFPDFEIMKLYKKLHFLSACASVYREIPCLVVRPWDWTENRESNDKIVRLERSGFFADHFARFAEPRYLRTDFGLKLSLHFEDTVLAGHGIRFLSQLQRNQCMGKLSRLRLRQNHWERVTSSSQCCSMDGRSLYDSTAWSDLCPVGDFVSGFTVVVTEL